MAQPLRIEDPTRIMARLITVRTILSRLWFVNNKKFEEMVLGYLAKYQEKYEVILYAFIFQGNHFHIVASFPKSNMAEFMRDFNARVAQFIKWHVKEFIGGPLFERRYSEQALILDTDVVDRFYYCALQAVNSGLAEKISDYPGYNSFSDAASGIAREYTVTDWSGYYDKKRFCNEANIKDFIKVHTLRYSRLPGYEGYEQKEYKNILHKVLEAKRLEIVKARKAKGLGTLTRELLLKVVPGSLPKYTKKSNRYSERPIVLTSCPIAKKKFLKWYFRIREAFIEASILYRKGLEAVFPPGTYKPPLFMQPVEI